MSSLDRGMRVEMVSVSALKPYASNPRTHTAKQVKQIADSIAKFGFTNPILTDRSLNVVAGHGRLEAAKTLGLLEVPTIRLEDMSEADKRAYILADNKLAENVGWDPELLAIELQGLIDIDFDVGIIGFEMPEIDQIIQVAGATEADDKVDKIPHVKDVPSVADPGELWALGSHRLLCGDALDPASYAKLLGDERAQLVFCDPPFNLKIAGNVSGKGKVKHGEFAMASGEMSEAEFTGFLQTAFRNLANVSFDGAVHFVCMDWRHLYELLSAGRASYSELLNLCVWAKTNAGMGPLYRSQHELVAVFKNGRARHINNVELGRHGRNRTNLWTYAGMNAFQAERDEALALHPTVKPVAMVEDAILDCSERGGVVLDAFVGSGTTLVAAERTGRRSYGIELDPHYVDVALSRFRDATGIEPVHLPSGLTLTELS